MFEQFAKGNREPVSFIRQVILSHSYSFLPVEVLDRDPRWQVITDRDVASFLRAAVPRHRRHRLT